MNEKSRERGEISKRELDRLEEEKIRAITILEQARAEHQRAIDDLIAKGAVPKTFNDSFERLKQAEREAFAAVEAWANIAIKEDR